ncbi:MAG: NERD domain-containing protein [Phycisphaeraceae bacterium]
MLPKHFSENTASHAEKIMFGRLRDQLNDEWVVLHSLGMTSHNRKPWAEIDFVMIGPPGVFCLEVKGGTISRRDAKWYTKSKNKNVSELKESPFSQVGSATAALYNFLSTRVPALQNALTAYLVATPDCRFDITGPDIEPEIVYDDRDADAKMPQYLDRAISYWTAETKRRWNRQPEELSPTDRQSIQKAMMRDFDLRPSLRSTLNALHADVIRYTAEQSAILAALSSNTRVIVRGGAGTGKTVIAVEEAKRLAESGKRVLLTCFNVRLSRYLQSLDLGTGQITVKRFHQLMRELIEAAGLVDQIPDADSDHIYRVAYPELALKALLNDGQSPKYDAIIIDEGQDLLMPDYVDVMDLLMEGGIQDGSWRLFLDPNQNLFGGIAPQGLRSFKDARPTEFDLKINCRNAKQIAVRSSVLSGAPLANVLRIDGGIDEMVEVKDAEDERRRISKIIGGLVHQGVDRRNIVVLSTRKLENSSLREGLIGGVAELTDGYVDLSQKTEQVQYATIQSFKGLEADAVILADLHNISSDDFAAAAYVGSTRAQAYLAVITHNSEAESLAELERRFGQRVLTTPSPA